MRNEYAAELDIVDKYLSIIVQDSVGDSFKILIKKCCISIMPEFKSLNAWIKLEILVVERMLWVIKFYFSKIFA
jgi:hypothetical protein